MKEIMSFLVVVFCIIVLFLLFRLLTVSLSRNGDSVNFRVGLTNYVFDAETQSFFEQDQYALHPVSLREERMLSEYMSCLGKDKNILLFRFS